MPACNDTGHPRAAIVGTGRVAVSLARAMADCRWSVGAIAGRNPEHTREAAAFAGTKALSIADAATQFEHVVIAVSDDAIESVAETLAQARMRSGAAVHTSGSKGPEALRPLTDAGVACGSMHPLQTIADWESGPAALRSCYFALSGEPAAVEFAGEIARALGAKTFALDAAARPLYHAAAVMASNYVCGLLDAALSVLAAAGIERGAALEALRPLFEQAARNSVSMGPEHALTGPILRGDAGTVRSHATALARLDADIAALYEISGRHVLDMARRLGLSPQAASEIAAALRSPDA